MYSPLTTVRVQNFQSIEDGTLELGQLTVIIGEGDAGKSAYLRAVRAALLNDGDDLDIRKDNDDNVLPDADGHKRCTVILTFEDGVTITWYKDLSKGGCYLVVDENGDTEFTKTAGQVPEEIAEYLGIIELEVDANTVLTPQLSDQHDQPFLLWETGSKRARIIGKATRLDMVVGAQMSCDKELRQHRREKEGLEQAVAEYQIELTSLGEPETLAFNIDLQGKGINVIADSVRIAGRARGLLTQFEEADSRARAVDCTDVKAQLRAVVFAVEAAQQLGALLDEYNKAEGNLNQYEDGLGEAGHELKLLRKAYVDQCEAAGVCVHCGGLLSHEECGL